MKKILISLTVFSSLLFCNELEKQIPELFNKMLDNFEKNKSIQNEETITNILKNYENGKLVFCETKFQRNIISKKKNWILDKPNKVFMNMEKEKYYYIHECKVFEESDKIYL